MEKAVAVGAVLGVIAAVTSIVSSISGVISDYQNTLMLNKLQKETNNNLAKFNKYFISQSNLNFIQFENIAKIISSHKRDLSELISDFNSDLISNFIKDTEREALIILAGGMPDSSDWVRDLMSLCLETNESKSFCSKVTLSEHLQFEDIIFVVDTTNEILELKIRVLMPQMSEMDNENPFLFKTKNIGFHNGRSGFVKMDIPEQFLQRIIRDPLTNEPVREIVEIKNCHRAICPASEMSYTDRCLCMSNILDGKTDNCQFRTLEQRPYCSFIKLDQGVLVSASDAIFSIRSSQFTKPEVTIKNNTILISQEGKLKCKGGNLNQIHSFINREIEKKSEISKLTLLETHVNISQLNEIHSLNQDLKNRLSSLELFTESEFISLYDGNFISKDTIISWISIFTFFVTLILSSVCIYRHFAAIKAQFRAPTAYIAAPSLEP